MLNNFYSIYDNLSNLNEAYEDDWSAYDRPDVFEVLDTELKELPPKEEMGANDKQKVVKCADGFELHLGHAINGMGRDAYWCNVFLNRKCITGSFGGFNPDFKGPEDWDAFKERLKEFLKTNYKCKYAHRTPEQRAAERDKVSKYPKAHRIYSAMCNEVFYIEYSDIEVHCASGNRSWEDGSYDHEWDEIIDWTYETSEGEVCERVIQNHWSEFLSGVDEDDPEFDNKLWEYMYENFDELATKYSKEIEEHFRDVAEDDARENYEY